MKITNVASVASKIIAAIVFVLLLTVLSIKDYPVTGNETQQNVITASASHHARIGGTTSAHKSL